MTSQFDIDIKGFLESSFLDWPGQIATVIFLAGCNFRCPFCHNHGLVLNPNEYPVLNWDDIKARLKKFTGWIDGVVVSGGEPTISKGLPDLIRDIKNCGFKVKLDTNGSRPSVLADLMENGLLDHVAMDIKAPLNEVAYARAAGQPGFLDKVKESLALLQSSGLPFTLRTTVVPGIHTEKDILLMARQLGGVPNWQLQYFNPENALDCSLRKLEPMNRDLFNLLDEKAHQIMEQSA
ncbi:MAG: anaerobic ribonucleoside-triphosphate reductase activating protein [Deltaproteobacteria bacterium]|nr:anaerobic ribonucleoside-triphosphate reductase activating protein [Deltaproteobacteria bacterium]MBW2051787.1 anaerobic ribonucleoside-triphosphate reductase activating protein [Deltaproteobacteria bacterium]MBW2140633.1 anaerobic ribonucleoside-triphosphate reductase activating protein [Deltaproteobacteria bacterium]MBW2323305.1 anaerobic ribonucleoside-triphosphate reductase activating protein [Deltaproteobacteria bacterium]